MPLSPESCHKTHFQVCWVSESPGWKRKIWQWVRCRTFHVHTRCTVQQYIFSFSGSLHVFFFPNFKQKKKKKRSKLLFTARWRPSLRLRVWQVWCLSFSPSVPVHTKRCRCVSTAVDSWGWNFNYTQVIDLCKGCSEHTLVFNIISRWASAAVVWSLTCIITLWSISLEKLRNHLGMLITPFPCFAFVYPESQLK